MKAIGDRFRRTPGAPEAERSTQEGSERRQVSKDGPRQEHVFPEPAKTLKGHPGTAERTGLRVTKKGRVTFAA